VSLTAVPGGTSVPGRGLCLVTLRPPFFFTTLLLQPAARSLLLAFLAVLPFTLGTMQLETTVALKPSSKVSLVLEVLGGALSLSGGM
jgi:hypothetical protein